MDRIFGHLGPVLAQVNKTLYIVLPILARALRASFGEALHQLEKTFGAHKLEKFTLALWLCTFRFFHPRAQNLYSLPSIGAQS